MRDIEIAAAPGIFKLELSPQWYTRAKHLLNVMCVGQPFNQAALYCEIKHFKAQYILHITANCFPAKRIWKEQFLVYIQKVHLRKHFWSKLSTSSLLASMAVRRICEAQQWPRSAQNIYVVIDINKVYDDENM